MAWIVLVVSGVLETVWATANAESRGLTRLAPTVHFRVSLLLNMPAWRTRFEPSRWAPRSHESRTMSRSAGASR